MISAAPIMPLSTIISVANMASRASVGLFSPCSMTEAIRATSMMITDRVSTSVPYGSPSFSASASACRITLKAHHTMAPNSQTNSRSVRG